MSKLDDKIRHIREEKIGRTNKRMLILEGVDDVDAFSALLDQRFRDWPNTWALAAAGNKKQALGIAQKEANWLVLVDQDELNQAEMAQQMHSQSNLLFLPRFCLESYVCDPAEIWLALPSMQREFLLDQQPPIDEAQFHEKILQELVPWLRHAALWQVINPLWAGLRARGFQDSLLRTIDFPADETIHSTLAAWANFINPERIWSDIQRVHAELLHMPQAEFLHRHLYAKNFFPEVVVGVLNRLFGTQKSERVWRIELFKRLPLPSDVEFLWQAMELPVPRS